MCFAFFKSISEDPDNVKQKWTFETLGKLNDAARKCKKVSIRIKYAIQIVDHFQRCKWVENGFAGEIVCEALRNMFSSKIEDDTALESVMTEAIRLMKQYT